MARLGRRACDKRIENKTNNYMIKFGIIGTGAIATQHIKCIQLLPDAALVAIASSNKERADTTQRQFGITCYDNYLDMMDIEKPDIVVICTASGNHLPPTLAAAMRGIHVLTEKPLEINVERADQMIATCKEHQVKLGVVFQNRFHPNFIKLKTAISENKLGRLLLGNAYIKWYRDQNYYQSSTWRGTLAGDGGAALINQGIHTIDLLLNVMGDVKTVFGKIQTTLHPIEGEDLGIGVLTFTSNALGTILGSTALYPGYPERLEIYGEDGSVVLEAGNIKSWHLKSELPIVQIEVPTASGATNPMAIGYELHKMLIQDMIDAVVNDREPKVSGVEARKSLALIQSIYASSSIDQPLSMTKQ